MPRAAASVAYYLQAGATGLMRELPAVAARSPMAIETMINETPRQGRWQVRASG